MLSSLMSTADVVNLEDFLEIRCSNNSDEQVYFQWQGEAYAQLPGESQTRVFDILGMNVARCFA